MGFRRIISIAIISVIALVAVVGVFDYAHADTKGQVKATIEVADDVKQNSDFKVNIVYSGAPLARVKGTLKFNRNYFKFVSGEVDDSDFDLVYFTATGDMEGNIELPLTFEALMGGSGAMSLETTMAITMDEESVTVGKTSTDIVIAGKNKNEVNTTVVEEEPDDESVISEPAKEIPEGTGHPYIIYIIGIGLGLLLLVIVLVATKKKHR